MHVLGRREGTARERVRSDGPAGRLGTFRARDGSAGAPVGVDFDRPHAACVVGKRGSGKSHTLGVLAEGLAATPGVTPLVCDPMGAFDGLQAGGFHVREPQVRASALPPRAWPPLLGLDPAGGPGALVWRAAADRETLPGMTRFVAGSDAPDRTRRAAANHLALADAWGVFAPDAPPAEAFLERATVCALAGLSAAPANAVVRVLATACYRARLDGRLDTLPWLLLDEAHVFLDGLARPALERLLTRGRAPGVSLVLATQRPTALPAVARSQTDLVVAHRLTAAVDRETVREVRPAGGEALDGRWPTERGTALVFDDAAERVVSVRVRERRTPGGGASPRASEVGDAATSDDTGPSAPEPTRTGHLGGHGGP
ncbi:DUF87 domain-containing protein [Salinirubellus salinus]|uniref:DUF87 domain-containing protein n=1 Tax=Salinirubellus salinus TaxID=1364945 RepID=A0A9E7R245_9EURY|nr:DUF87 domain-containing protein [Salinirubellus salinus]UWM54191.1 DUF87 domain-containing protein [Salinirubellus salinus]